LLHLPNTTEVANFF